MQFERLSQTPGPAGDVRLSRGSDPAAFEAECRIRVGTGRPCRIDQLTFPVSEHVLNAAGAPPDARIRWTLTMTSDGTASSPMNTVLRAQVAWQTAPLSMIEEATIVVEPATGMITARRVISRSLSIPGRPVGVVHRRPPAGSLTGQARHWAELAADEDEAVEAFRIHVTELRTIGAPEALITRAEAAWADETRHRDLALGRASALAGRPVTLGTRTRPAEPRTDRLAILRSVARDGALNETLSFCLLMAEAEACPDPLERALLLDIAGDEVRHAALAWDTLRWAWPSLTPEERALVSGDLEGPLELTSMLGHVDEVATLGREARRHVVGPLAVALAEGQGRQEAPGYRL